MFVAIPLEEKVKEPLIKIMGELGGKYDMSFTDPRNLHVTLKFLGDISPAALETVKRQVREIAGHVYPFDVSFEGCGFFGSRGRVSVVWTGVGKGRERIVALMEEIEKGLKAIRNDEFSPHPHITLARVRLGKNNDLLVQELEKWSSVHFGDMKVTEIHIMDSSLSSRGPAYKIIERVRMGAA